MGIQRDTVIIVDVEATCWENQKAPAGQRSEIIEIGICTLELKSRIIANKRSIFTKPIASTVSEFCTQLTSISPVMIEEQAIPFEDACAILQSDYDSKNRLWMSWGNYDRRMFMEQCQWRGVEYPFAENHCNLKSLFANLYGNRLGMAAALTKANLELEGTHHRGDDDAYNISRILAYLLETHGDDLLDSFWG
jgi:inhibitor of KinA sporulation pathway (predicted exonuclease)